MNAAAQLRDARRRAGLTQAQLATQVGTSQATLSAYEHGHKQPSVDTLSRVLAATGSRLVVEPGRQPIRRPSRSQLARAARSLTDVLALAEALPTRHEHELRFPKLGPPVGSAT